MCPRAEGGDKALGSCEPPGGINGLEKGTPGGMRGSTDVEDSQNGQLSGIMDGSVWGRDGNVSTAGSKEGGKKNGRDETDGRCGRAAGGRSFYM